MGRHARSQSLVHKFLAMVAYILRVWFFCLSFKVKSVGGGPTCQSLFFACAKKSNQKKAHNLTKIDPDITYSVWGFLIQYI